jgi:hypothetical protein
MGKWANLQICKWRSAAFPQTSNLKPANLKPATCTPSTGTGYQKHCPVTLYDGANSGHTVDGLFDSYMLSCRLLCLFFSGQD